MNDYSKTLIRKTLTQEIAKLSAKRDKFNTMIDSKITELKKELELYEG